MSELFIDPAEFGKFPGRPLPADHRAKSFADGLPVGHPIRRLLDGEMQWLGENKNVYGFLRLFHEVYEDRLVRFDAGTPDVAAEIRVFEGKFPKDVLYRGRRYSFRTLLTNARDAIAMRAPPPLRSAASAAFERTFAALVRAVRLS